MASGHGHGASAPIKHTPATHATHAAAQHNAMALHRSQPAVESSEKLSTPLMIEQQPNVPPTLRMHTRWEYLEEYIGYWKMDHVCKVLGAVLLAVGISSLPVFAPGGLLMIAVSARLLDLGWWYNFIWSKYGYNRTVTLVD